MREVRIETNKTQQLVASAQRLAIELALSDVPWREVNEQLERGFARAGVELTIDEKLELYESWSASFDWTAVAT